MEKIKNNIFFIIKDGALILWDYEHHQQYKVSSAYLERLLEITQGHEVPDDEISKDLERAGLLSLQQPQVDWAWDDLSWIYHVGTKNPPLFELEDGSWFDAYLEDCSHKKPPENDETLFSKDIVIPLPPFDPNLFRHINFLEALDRRQTSREFNGDPISLNVFSSLLYKSFAFMPSPWKDLQGMDLLGRHKISPSAGGLHPFDFYVLVHHVEGIDSGLYVYDPEQHLLYLQKLGNFQNEMITCLTRQDFSYNLSFGVFFVADFRRIWWKYVHSRGYRHVLIDAGHQSQTFLLIATALGLLTWPTGAIDDNLAEEFLNVKEPYRSPIFFVGAGCGTPKPLHSSMISKILTKS